MSARSATAGTLGSPMSAHSPVPEDRIRGSSPTDLSRSTILAVVRTSPCASSGCMCRSRRNSMSSASCPARKAARSRRSSLCDMRTLLWADEPVLGELRYQRIHHVRQSSTSRHHGTLTLVGGSPFQHLVDHLQL